MEGRGARIVGTTSNKGSIGVLQGCGVLDLGNEGSDGVHRVSLDFYGFMWR